MAIRVHIHAPSGQMIERLTTEDPHLAEGHYLRLAQRRDLPAHAVVVHDSTGLLADARYRLDPDWPGAPREQVPERYRRMWATPPDGWTGPTTEQLRGLIASIDMSGAEVARRIGVAPRQWRRWLADPKAGQSRIPYPAWVTALRVTGWLPADEHV